MSEVCGIILAAGEGKRMKSNLPKVLSRVLDKPMLKWVIDAARGAGIEALCVVDGFKREEVERYLATLPEAYETAFQAERKGTAHAVMQARGFLERHRDGDVLILNGDAPFLDEETIRKAYRRHREGNHAVTLISAYLDDPFGYGRVLRDEGTGRMAAVVEEKDADAAQKRIREVSSGAYWFQVEKLLGVLSSIGNHNAQGEYYLPDAVKLLLERGGRLPRRKRRRGAGGQRRRPAGGPEPNRQAKGVSIRLIPLQTDMDTNVENEGEFIMNFHGKDIKIFTANSNPMVAKRIAECLGLPLGKSEVGTFSDGEIAVSLFESVRGSDCFIVQSTCSPVNNNIMELLIMIDAMKRASAARITAVIPYFGYARQDRKAKARDPISAKLVADLITTAGADRVLTMDLHAPQIQGFFNIPVDHLVGAPTLASFLRGRIGRDNEEYVVVSPDLGSVTRARNFASRLGCPLAIIDKRRQRANVCEVMNIIGDVKGKKVILVDDMIATAGTLCNGAAAIIEKGGALEVTAAATHGVLSGPAIERIADSPIKELILLDTVPVTGERKLDKMTILSVAPLFAEAIERIYEDKPVSPMFL